MYTKPLDSTKYLLEALGCINQKTGIFLCTECGVHIRGTPYMGGGVKFRVETIPRR